jgi:hypothetical protein
MVGQDATLNAAGAHQPAILLSICPRSLTLTKHESKLSQGELQIVGHPTSFYLVNHRDFQAMLGNARRDEVPIYELQGVRGVQLPSVLANAANGHSAADKEHRARLLLSPQLSFLVADVGGSWSERKEVLDELAEVFDGFGVEINNFSPVERERKRFN